MNFLKVHELMIGRDNKGLRGTAFYLNKRNVISITPILNEKTHSSILMVDGSYLKVFEDLFCFSEEEHDE